MARTHLFARLRELYARSRACAPEPRRGERELSRRVFVQHMGLGLAALSAASVGCESDDDGSGSPASDGPSVAVIGAGMAGLMCTHLLEQAGVRVTLYEGSKRVGGRMYSVRDMFPDGQVAELGGEFVDSGHVTMHMLAEAYDIALDDREMAVTENTRSEVWWVEGKAVPEATIVAQFSEVAPKMLMLMEQADDEEDDTVFVMLDNTSMAAWLDENLSEQPELKSVLENAYRGEYGRELEEQSVLNLIYLIGSDDPDPFRIFGDSDERYHTHLGSSTFVEKLAAELEGEVQLEHVLVKAEDAESGFKLTFAVGKERVLSTVDYVVFALPFTLLRKVDLTGLGISEDKRRIIDEIGYGTNAKIMGAFSERVWLAEHDALGSVTSDEPFQQCWDTSIGQKGESGLLTNFLGGKQGEESGKGSAEDWYTRVMVAGAEKVFPGALAAYVKDSAVRMHWPTQPFALGSYACYAPGQWAFYGYEGAPEADGRLHFCGEHTSLDFQGYMEGAAETGALTANAILEREGKRAPAFLRTLMVVKRAVPQPALGEHARATRHVGRARLLADALYGLVSGSAKRAS